MVDWLYTRVEGFKERREARKYASSMLKRGFLRHTVNKVTFSEQCYYVFGDLCSSEWRLRGGAPGSPAPDALTHCPLPPDLEALNLNSGSSGASDQDTLAPLPHPAPWPLSQGYPYQYPGPPPCFPPAYQDPGFSYGSGSAGSQQSEGEGLLGPAPLRPLPGSALCAPPARLGLWVGVPSPGEQLRGAGRRNWRLGGCGTEAGGRRQEAVREGQPVSGWARAAGHRGGQAASPGACGLAGGQGQR